MLSQTKPHACTLFDIKQCIYTTHSCHKALKNICNIRQNGTSHIWPASAYIHIHAMVLPDADTLSLTHTPH